MALIVWGLLESTTKSIFPQANRYNSGCRPARWDLEPARPWENSFASRRGHGRIPSGTRKNFPPPRRHDLCDTSSSNHETCATGSSLDRPGVLVAMRHWADAAGAEASNPTRGAAPRIGGPNSAGGLLSRFALTSRRRG